MIRAVLFKSVFLLWGVAGFLQLPICFAEVYSPRMALLTSVDLDAMAARLPRSSLKDYIKGYVSNLESRYEYQIQNKSGFFNVDYDVFENATAAELYYVLASGYYQAVIYIGHGGAWSSRDSGLGSDPLLVDYLGRDVTFALGMIHPNVAYLALAGCSSKELARQLKDKRGYFKGNPDTIIDTFDGKVAAEDALSESTKRSIQAMRKFKPKSCALQSKLVKQGIPIEITRTMSPAYEKGEVAGPVVVRFGNDVVMTFAAGELNSRQVWKTWMPVSGKINKADFKIVVESGSKPAITKSKTQIGKFEFKTTSDARWELFADAQGKAVGVSNAIYRLKGELPKAQPYQAFPCIEIEPVRAVRERPAF